MKFSTFHGFFFRNEIQCFCTSFILAEITLKKMNQQISFKNSPQSQTRFYSEALYWLKIDQILYENSFKNE